MLGRGAAGTPVQSLLVEAGPRLASALLAQDQADRLLAFVAPIWIGDGQRAFATPPADQMSDATCWPESEWTTFGPDALLTAYRHTAPDWLADG
jgi:diaminohydroxyphosphoribosylaminopyrimidine deaminase/5-amino-6-(5-phosphoribosylamino)uracil reductase